MLRKAAEFFGYVMVSVAGFAVDVATLWILTAQLGMHYVLATGIAFLVGGVCVYILSVKYVFRYRRVTNLVAESTSFIVLGLVGLFANVVLVALLVRFANLNLPAAKIISSGVTLVINFAVRKAALFSESNSIRIESQNL